MTKWIKCGETKQRSDSINMSTSNAPVPVSTIPPNVTLCPPRTPSHVSSTLYYTPNELSPLDADSHHSSDLFMAEDARGAIPPSTIDSTVTTNNTPHDLTSTTADTAKESWTASTEYPDPSLLPGRDDSSLLPLSSENGDQERGNNQTLMEEHEMRRKLMDMESSFLPEPSTIDVAATGPTAGADDTYLVGVPGVNQVDMQTESSELSLVAASETNQDTGAQDAARKQTAQVHSPPAIHAEQVGQEGNNTTLDTVDSSPAAAAAVRRTRSALFDTGPDAAYLSQDERPFKSQSENESQLTPSKLRSTSRSLSPGPSRLFGDQSGSGPKGSRPKYLNSRQAANRHSHSSVASTNTDATPSDATLGADYALQSGGAASEQYGTRSNMIRTTSLGSMASGVSGYSEENSLEKRNSGFADGGLQTLDEEEGSPHSRAGSSRPPMGFDDASAPETPKPKPRGSIPSDTAIAERVKGIQVPSTFVQRFREDFGNTGLSPEKRLGISTPALARTGRTMTLKEQSSTIDRLSKENFDLKMRIHFLNEALNKRSEEGIKEMISENVELKSDKLKLQKDNQTLKRKIRDLEKQLKAQQSDKESMVNHDPEGSEDGDRDAAQDGEVIFLREKVESYEIEIERLRSESVARESEKRRLAEMVKSLGENRAGGSETGAREERVCRTLIAIPI